jgi:hypothetical protein
MPWVQATRMGDDLAEVVMSSQSLRVLLLLLATMGASAGPAIAVEGLHLRWGAYCPADPRSTQNVDDPCDGSSQMNGVTYVLVGSFETGVSLPSVVGEDFNVVIAEARAPIGDYWRLEDENQPGQINPGGCRGASSVTGNVGSLAVQISGAAYSLTGCTRPWGSNTFGTISYTYDIADPPRGHISGSFLTSPGVALTTGVEYVCFVATIDTNHQVADPGNPPSYVCSGCRDPVDLQFGEVGLRLPGGGEYWIFPVTDYDSQVFWQGGFTPPDPVRRATWGQVKSLYR